MCLEAQLCNSTLMGTWQDSLQFGSTMSRSSHRFPFCRQWIDAPHPVRRIFASCCLTMLDLPTTTHVHDSAPAQGVAQHLALGV